MNLKKWIPGCQIIFNDAANTILYKATIYGHRSFAAVAAWWLWRCMLACATFTGNGLCPPREMKLYHRVEAVHPSCLLHVNFSLERYSLC